MAKITIPAVTGGFSLLTDVNARLQQVEDELNTKVLYKTNPAGEDNSLDNDIDMDGNDILNIGTVNASTIIVNGTDYETTLQAISDEATASAAEAEMSSITATASALAGGSTLLIPSYQAIRDYAGAEQTFYARGKTVAGDGGESFFQKKSGAAPGTYVDDGEQILVPTSGDGSAGWIRSVTKDHQFDTLAEVVASLQLSVGSVVTIADRDNSTWDVVLSSTVTENTFDIVQCTGVGTLSLVLRTGSSVQVEALGAVGDGVAFDHLVFKFAIDNYKEVLAREPSVSFYFDAQVSVNVGNRRIAGSGRACHIEIKDGNSNGFNITNQTGVTIEGFKISCKTLTGTLGGLNGKAAIFLSGASQCVIRDNFIFNIYNAGIRLFSSSNNKVQSNYFGDWFTTATPNGDASNVKVIGTSSFNLIDGNHCLGNNAGKGIMVSDYTVPLVQQAANVITNNIVDSKLDYGILYYSTTDGSPTGVDTRSIISGNSISNIQGTGTGGNSGAGIYVQSASGMLVSNNTIYNCCVQTTIFGTLAMAHIAVNTTSLADDGQISVIGNHIHALRGPGIWFATSFNISGIVANNTIRHEQASGSDNNGIVISNCDNINVQGNQVRATGPTTGIYAWTSGRDSENLNISDNNVITTGSPYVIGQITSGNWKKVKFRGNAGETTGTTGANITRVDNMSISDNFLKADQFPLFSNNVTNVLGTGNIFEGTGGAVVHTIGGNIGSIWNYTNIYIGGIINHFVSGGGVLELYGNATPAVGTYSVGDRIIQSIPIVGNPKAWRCTVTGTPGTWVSEGNL